MTFPPAYYAKKKEAERWKALRQDALDHGHGEASIAYGWVAIRLMSEALALMDVKFPSGPQDLFTTYMGDSLGSAPRLRTA